MADLIVTAIVVAANVLVILLIAAAARADQSPTSLRDPIDTHAATTVRQPMPDSALLFYLAALAETQQRRALTAMRPTTTPRRRTP